MHVIVGNKLVTMSGDATQGYLEAGSLEELKERALSAAYAVHGDQRCVILLDSYRERRAFDPVTGHLGDDTCHEARALIYLEG